MALILELLFSIQIVNTMGTLYFFILGSVGYALCSAVCGESLYFGAY